MPWTLRRLRISPPIHAASPFGRAARGVRCALERRFTADRFWRLREGTSRSASVIDFPIGTDPPDTIVKIVRKIRSGPSLAFHSENSLHARRTAVRDRRAFRRRQDLAGEGTARAQAASCGCRSRTPRARGARPRSTGASTTSYRCRNSSEQIARRAVPRARAGVRQLLRHRARAGRSAARAGPRRDPRDRLAGRPAGARGAARMRLHLHPAALARRPGGAPAQPAARTRTKSSPAACAMPWRICRTGASSTTWWSTTTSTERWPTWRASSKAGRSALRGRAAAGSLQPLLADLLA